MSEPSCSDELRLTKAHVRHKNIATSLNLLSSERATRINILMVHKQLVKSKFNTHYANLTSNSDVLTGASVNINLGGGGFISVSV